MRVWFARSSPLIKVGFKDPKRSCDRSCVCGSCESGSKFPAENERRIPLIFRTKMNYDNESSLSQTGRYDVQIPQLSTTSL